MRGLSTLEANRRAEELSERLGVRPGLDVAVQDLSKGNVQKVALAQAFLAPVDLLALDEPRTAVDPQAVAALDDLLATARRQGTAVAVSDPTSEATYSEARRFQIEARRLRPLGGVGSSSEERVAVRLRPAHGSGEPTPPFARLAQTWSVDGDGAINLWVHPGRSDELLRLALGEGWSVVDVRRQPGAGAFRPAGEAGPESP